MERKLATVLFVDLVDSTSFVSASDPEVVRRRVTQFFDRVSSIIERYGGTVEKFAGDAVMHEGHHQRADPVRVGELQVWELVNETGQDHPFHIHGFFFQVVQENGTTPLEVAWKDTVNVPRKSKTTIAWLPDDRPGEWMYHCHILEHHASGMMAHFEVIR